MELTIQNLNFKYSQNAENVLKNISLTIPSGSYWCLAGPNGAGKSTLLKLICGLLPFKESSGKILWNQKDISFWNRLELAKKIAFVPGTLKTLFPITVEEFILQGRFTHSSFWSKYSTHDKMIATLAMKKVNIEPLRSHLMTQISSGETQLALIARAIAQEPQVLILDEATSNLDLGFQIRIFKLLEEFHKQGLTIVLVEHDLNVISEFCPNAIWFYLGSLYAQGTMQETLTSELLNHLYSGKIIVGKNPMTSQPKVFFS